jgi:hypothetical protein
VSTQSINHWQLQHNFLFKFLSHTHTHSHTVGGAVKCFVRDAWTSRPPCRVTLLTGPCPSVDLVTEKFDSHRHPSLPLNGWAE